MKSLARASVLVFLAVIAVHPLGADVERRERGPLVMEDIPEIPGRIADRMLQYQNTRTAALRDWMPSGGMLISTRFGETAQIHLVERPGGARRQITFFPEPVGAASVCPNPATPGFLFARDVGGGENYQIFHFDMVSGRSVMVTDGSSRNGAVRWSNRGDRFAYYSTRRNGRDWDLYVTGLEPPRKTRRVLEKTGTWIPVDWSPDDKRLLVLRYVSAAESYYHVLDLASGATTRIHPVEERIAYGSARWARDGKGIFITSNEGSEFQRLKYYDLDGKSFTDLTAAIPWDVDDLEIGRDGDRLAFTTNEDGLSKLYLLDVATRRYSKAPGIPAGVIGNLRFHPDGKRVGFTINTPQTPGDVYALDLGSDRLTRWTHSEVGGLNPETFVIPDLIEYETYDEVDGRPRRIPAFYYKPKTHGPHPVLIYIHGGPEGQYLPRFSPGFQYNLNELGLAILAPNVRGSSGYGKSYLLLDNADKREDSVRDIGKLLDWIETRPELDASRVGVLGGSYGGYMVLAALTHYSDRLKAGVDVVGISNFVTFLENTSDYRRDLRRVEYGDERDPKMREFLLRISPARQAEKITRPLFVVQGQNDPRVPVTESEQMVEAIRRNGNPVWYLLARDEGHGFRKKSNSDFYTNAVSLFLETHLLPKEASGGGS